MDLASNLLKPYSPPDGNLVDVVAPLLIFGLVAFLTALPTYEIVGIKSATAYGILSFVLLCFLRKWMLERAPSKDMNFLSVLIPGFAWVVISLATATMVGVWTPTLIG